MQIGVIGCGKMATALVAGAIRSGAFGKSSIIGFHPSPGGASFFGEATGVNIVDDMSALSECGVFLLCTKPQHSAEALESIKPASPPLIISVVAGMSLHKLAAHAPKGSRIIRCMPNTPSLVGEGATGFSLGENTTEEDAKTAETFLGSVGLALEVPEDQLDAVTGVSGSGPAYIFLVIEAMADAGVRCGLPRAQALRLAAQTVRGAATMVRDTGTHPGELKDQVASPGGTTIAGLAALEEGGLRSTLIQAVTAAAARSKELGKD